MKLTLILPGLAWLDAYDGADVCKGLALPALQTLLGRGRLIRREAALGACLTDLWQAPPSGLARLAASEAGLPADDGHWLLADPAHLRVERDRALLADVGVMTLGQEEADAFCLTLNRHFAADGLRFHPAWPGRWLLQTETEPGARFSPLWDAVGDDAHAHRPQGGRGLDWDRLLNEMQMLLYASPLNDQREARGELAVNSLWLWGEGEPADWQAPAARLLADDEALSWLARRSGMACDAAPYAFDGLAPGEDCLIVLDSLQAAAQYRDAWGWRETLPRLERDWFQPLLSALKAGQIEQLTLIAHGTAGFELRLKPGDLWKFWKRPLALAALY
nr:hypothetical protein [Chromobacterium sp. ASV5]